MVIVFVVVRLFRCCICVCVCVSERPQKRSVKKSSLFIFTIILSYSITFIANNSSLYEDALIELKSSQSIDRRHHYINCSKLLLISLLTQRFWNFANAFKSNLSRFNLFLSCDWLILFVWAIEDQIFYHVLRHLHS